MSQPPNARSKSVFVTGIAVVALLVGAVLAWRHWRTPVPVEDVTAYLDGTVGGGRVRFSDVRVAVLRRDDSGLLIAVAANSSSLGPLYSKIDASEYLHRTFRLDPEPTAEARRLIAAGAPSGDRRLAGAGPVPPDPYQSIIIQQSSPGGAEFNFQGVIGAKRESGKWSFTLESGGFEGTGPQGGARSMFPEGAFVAGDSNDDGRLRVLANDFQAFANRLAETQKKPDSAGTAASGGSQEAFLAAIAPGRILHGTAFESGEQHGTTLYLEITALTPSNEVSALLRNEGSWRSARAFQGTWSDDENSGVPALTLTSLADQAVRNAGPYLENAQSWTFALQMDRHGSLSGQDGFFKYQFRPMSAEQASAIKVRLDAEFNRSVSATEAGILYIGSAHSQDSGTSEPILVRFTGNSGDGGAINARIESTSRSWMRPLRGIIVANSRRSEGEPIRLRSGAGDAVADAPVESVLGVREDLEIHLRAEDGSLVGEDGRFSYKLQPANTSDLKRLEAEGTQRARRFLSVIRTGINFDGTLREEQGYIGHARLEVVSVDRQTNAIAVRLHSLTQPGVHRDFAGTCEPTGELITLTATSRGVFNTSDGFDIPFFKAPTPASLHLALTSGSLAGGIEGNSSWVLDFPTAVFLSAQVEGLEADSAPANGSVYPQFPKAPGAYLLSGASWLPLPANHGHVVSESIGPKSDVQLPTNIADALQMGVDHIVKAKEAKKVPFLEFDGKDPRPESSAQATTILFVGPELSGASPVEISSEEIKKDGTRSVEISDSNPEKMRFAALRAPAYVRQVAPGLVLLTTTSTLAPGPYAVNADHGYELIQN